jgi:hypothetical protein
MLLARIWSDHEAVVPDLLYDATSISNAREPREARNARQARTGHTPGPRYFARAGIADCGVRVRRIGRYVGTAPRSSVVCCGKLAKLFAGCNCENRYVFQAGLVLVWWTAVSGRVR